MKRRAFIQKCAVVGAVAGMTSRNVLGAASKDGKDSNTVDNSSIAGVWKTLKPGEVKAISGPGTDAPNTMSNVMYLTPAGEGSRNGSSYFGNWCSGAYARHDGASGAMVFSNGGDADYWGNEIYKFSIDTRVWSRECARSGAMNGRTKAGDDSNFDETWGEHTTPGGTPPPQPGVPHSYDQIEYLPPKLGGGAKGSFMFCTRTIVYRYRRFSHPHVFDLNAKKWRRGSATPGIVGFGASDAPTWCFDSSRNRFWGLMGGASGVRNEVLRYLDFSSETGLATSGSLAMPSFLSPGYPTSRYWPKGDLLLVIGVSEGVVTLLSASLDPAGKKGFSAVRLSGAKLPVDSQGYGLVYCDDMDCFFVRTASGHRQKIWRITPPESRSTQGTWAVEEITMRGGLVDGKDNPQGMWKRFMYVPPLKCLMWVDDIKGAVYAYRPTEA